MPPPPVARSLLDEGFADPDTFFGLLHPDTTRRKTYDMVQVRQQDMIAPM
jgi:hypothetical protein